MSKNNLYVISKGYECIRWNAYYINDVKNTTFFYCHIDYLLMEMLLAGKTGYDSMISRRESFFIFLFTGICPTIKKSGIFKNLYPFYYQHVAQCGR